MVHNMQQLQELVRTGFQGAKPGPSDVPLFRPPCMVTKWVRFGQPVLSWVELSAKSREPSP